MKNASTPGRTTNEIALGGRRSGNAGAPGMGPSPSLPFEPGSRRNPNNNPKHLLLRDKENLDSLRAFYRQLWWCYVQGKELEIVGVQTEEVQEIIDAADPFRDSQEERAGGFLKTLEEESEGSLLSRVN